MIFIYCFFFNDTATTEIYTLSLHDALPISNASEILKKRVVSIVCKESSRLRLAEDFSQLGCLCDWRYGKLFQKDRKSTRLNSSHANISYAVFCLKKKKKIK